MLVLQTLVPSPKTQDNMRRGHVAALLHVARRPPTSGQRRGDPHTKRRPHLIIQALAISKWRQHARSDGRSRSSVICTCGSGCSLSPRVDGKLKPPAIDANEDASEPVRITGKTVPVRPTGMAARGTFPRFEGPGHSRPEHSPPMAMFRTQALLAFRLHPKTMQASRGGSRRRLCDASRQTGIAVSGPYQKHLRCTRCGRKFQQANPQRPIPPPRARKEGEPPLAGKGEACLEQNGCKNFWCAARSQERAK